MNPSRRATAFVVPGVLAVLVACGGSNKPAASSGEDTVASVDAGTEPGWEGDAGASSEADAAPAGETSASAPAAAPASGSEDGARALLEQFVDPNADHAALSKSLKPSSADFKAMFDDATAPKMEAAYAKEWDAGTILIKPKNAKHSGVKVWGATGAELASGTGNAKEFPGGYKKIAKHLAPAITFYAFKFVDPKKDKDGGMAYDGLAYVNGHWVIAPKPFRVDRASADKPDKPSKPKKKR